MRSLLQEYFQRAASRCQQSGGVGSEVYDYADEERRNVLDALWSGDLDGHKLYMGKVPGWPTSCKVYVVDSGGGEGSVIQEDKCDTVKFGFSCKAPGMLHAYM